MATINNQKKSQLTPPQALIKDMLKTSGCSLYQIAVELKIQPTHLKKIFNGKIRKPRFKTFEKLIKNKYVNKGD